jgi:hypothetical protein
VVSGWGLSLIIWWLLQNLTRVVGSLFSTRDVGKASGAMAPPSLFSQMHLFEFLESRPEFLRIRR